MSIRIKSRRWMRGCAVALIGVFAGILVIPLYADLSDFSFRPQLRKLRYVEEFYSLFAQNHMPSTDSTARNIWYLQVALNSPFKHPLKALCVIRTEEEHEQYKRLLRTRIAFLLAQGFMQLGYRYDKEEIYFFNHEFAKDLSEGFDLARYYYREAIEYWNEARRMASEVYRRRSVRLRGVLIEAIQDEARRIHAGDINYRRTIDFRLRELDRKQQMLARGQFFSGSR